MLPLYFSLEDERFKVLGFEEFEFDCEDEDVALGLDVDCARRRGLC